jgi:hypothetical protein
MTTNFNTGVPSLDPEDLKRDLKEFLQGQDEFNSYNFEGSALSTILDLLTKNTHYLSFVANMLARESFLSRAEIRKNIVDHAQKLSYVPRSKVSPKAEISLAVAPSDVSSLALFITAPKGTQFASNYDGEVVTFTTTSDHVIYLDSNSNTYGASGISVNQGSIVVDRITYLDQPYLILSANDIDTSTLQIHVYESEGSSAFETFRAVTDITEVGPNSNVFFLYEHSDGRYRVEFGDGVIGAALQMNNVIEASYVAVSGDIIANSITELTAIDSIEGYTDIDVVVDVPSYGGALRETASSIKKNAPLAWEAQSGSVTPVDYELNTKRLFPQAKSVKAWGGEDNVPPVWGKVFIAVSPKDGVILVKPVKDAIKALLKSTNVGAVVPEIVDPEYISVNLTVSAGYDKSKADTSMSTVFGRVSALVSQYSQDKLDDFSKSFISSDLVKEIKTNNPSISSCDLSMTISKDILIAVGISARYLVHMGNSISPGSVSSTGFCVTAGCTDLLLEDDGEGSLYLTAADSLGVRSIIVSDAGTVDYSKGVIDIKISPINVARPDSRIRVSCVPSRPNLFAAMQDIIRIERVTVEENRLVTS